MPLGQPGTQHDPSVGEGMPARQCNVRTRLLHCNSDSACSARPAGPAEVGLNSWRLAGRASRVSLGLDLVFEPNGSQGVKC